MSVFRGFLWKRVCTFSIAPRGEWAKVTKGAPFASYRSWVLLPLLPATREEAFWVKSASLSYDRAPFSCFAWRVHRRCRMLGGLSLWRAWLCVGDCTISYPLIGVNVLVDKRNHLHCGVGRRVLRLELWSCALGEVIEFAGLYLPGKSGNRIARQRVNVKVSAACAVLHCEIIIRLGHHSTQCLQRSALSIATPVKFAEKLAVFSAHV
jgi:hypothetical protein